MDSEARDYERFAGLDRDPEEELRREQEVEREIDRMMEEKGGAPTNRTRHPKAFLQYTQALTVEQAARIYHAQRTGLPLLSSDDQTKSLYLAHSGQYLTFQDWLDRNRIALFEKEVR